MIAVRNLSVNYGNTPVLHDVSFTVNNGEWVLITGPSGCGKSTLARALSGLIPHAIGATMGGAVEIAGLDTGQHTIPELAQHVGMIFQNPSSQLFHLHVEDEVAFGLRNLGLPEQDVQARTDWALKAIGIDHLRHDNPAQLSGGQKQCIAIAAVIAMKPAVLILDEPTASLDAPNTKRVLDVLQILQTSLGLTIIMVEHRLSAVMPHVDRVLVMDQGQIRADCPPQDLHNNASLRDELGIRHPTAARPVTWDELVSETLTTQYNDNPLIQLSGVSAGYQRRDVIHEIELSIYPGEFIALVGDNGAGKSTLARVIAGLNKPASGKVHYQGKRRPQPGLDVSMLFQNPADQVFTDSVDEEVRFGPENFDRFDTAHHQELLTETDLLALRQQRPTAISVGQQQRCVLAACIALTPKLVILDEPTLGQDWGHLQQLMDYLQQLNRRGTTILLISHDYKLVFRYARRAIYMESGRIKTDGIFTQKWQKEHIHETIHA